MAKVSVKPQMSAVHMEISKVSELTTVCAPAVYIHGIPWTVEASDGDDGYLAIYLKCGKKDKSSNWAVAAGATIKLMPYSSSKRAFVTHIPPTVFDSTNHSIGKDEFIDWEELFDRENKYVQNDSIQLKIEITAENPSYAKRAILKFEPIDKCCDHGAQATFQLTVKSVENLLAVRSPQFAVRGLPWDLTVYKSQESNLGVKLTNKSTEEVSCEIEMSVELVSSNDGMKPIQKSDFVANSDHLNIGKVIAWDEMLKSKRGFVNHNAITLEVKLKADKPEGDVATNNPNNAATKRRRLECSICFEDLDDQDISTTTPCGHLFCTSCVTEAVKHRNVCPMCKGTVKNLQRVYLPISK